MLLLYADDVVLLSSTWRSLQQHLLALERFCEESKLKVNLKKSQVMVFQARKSPIPPLKYQGHDLMMVDRYRYLGLEITDNLMNFLGVKQYTTYIILLEEVGLAPIESIALSRTIQYIRRLGMMGQERLPKKALMVSRQHGRRKRGWWKDLLAWWNIWNLKWESFPKEAEDLRKFLGESLMGYLWDDAHGSKATYYKENVNSMLSHNTAKYLLEVHSTKTRQFLSRLRLSCHTLRIETGRWSNPPVDRKDRKCTLCPLGLVEDEVHTLFICPSFDMIRRQYTEIAGVTNKRLEEYLEEMDSRTVGAMGMAIFAQRKIKELQLGTG